MASRSMNYLRKNAKVIMVFMGIVCMITFVVEPPCSIWPMRAAAWRTKTRSSLPGPRVICGMTNCGCFAFATSSLTRFCIGSLRKRPTAAVNQW